MQLQALLENVIHHSLPEALRSLTPTAVVNDSRHIVSGCVFLAARGLSSHALDYLTSAQCEMAAAIVYEPEYDLTRFDSHSDKFIPVTHLHQCVGEIGRRFYPSAFASPLIGVTGTNGKTSVTQFIAQLADYGFIGTMGYGNGRDISTLSHTTPDALSIQRILSELSATVAGVAMEVSSHALVLDRVSAVDVEIAVFTNLSQDHLDFHRDMEDYFAAKTQLFLKDSVKAAVINTDDEYGYRLAQMLKASGKKVIAFGQQSQCQEFEESVRISLLSLSRNGITANLSLNLAHEHAQVMLLSSVWGAFNAHNLLAAMLALYAADQQTIATMLTKLQRIKGVKGRIEPITLGDQKTAIIDYAHTPDALKNTLLSLREHMQAQARLTAAPMGKLYTVFGCGGDRDRQKRPLMAEAVSQYSDFAIVTDDNPRTEDPQRIFDDMLAGDIERVRFKVIPSRREAIEFGLSRLAPNDVLLIAGKGHEDYQIIGNEKIHFSDHEVVQDWLT